MTLEQWFDIAGGACILAGALLSLIAAIGLVRLPDAFGFMHAASKPQSLGIVLLCAGLAFVLRDPAATGMLVLVAALQLLTSPVATQMMARSAYRTGQFRRDSLARDEGDASGGSGEADDVTGAR